MNQTRSVAVLSWLYIAVGVVGLIYHAVSWSSDEPTVDQAWVLGLRVLAVIGGVFTLRGAVWSRWLLVVWIAYHVYLSVGHSSSQLIVHSVLFLLTALVMLRVPRSPQTATH